jgi:hypothetical protein
MESSLVNNSKIFNILKIKLSTKTTKLLSLSSKQLWAIKEASYFSKGGTHEIGQEYSKKYHKNSQNLHILCNFQIQISNQYQYQ